MLYRVLSLLSLKQLIQHCQTEKDNCKYYAKFRHNNYFTVCQTFVIFSLLIQIILSNSKQVAKVTGIFYSKWKSGEISGTRRINPFRVSYTFDTISDNAQFLRFCLLENRSGIADSGIRTL